jgi:hypothetical protein
VLGDQMRDEVGDGPAGQRLVLPLVRRDGVHPIGELRLGTLEEFEELHGREIGHGGQ